MKNKHLSKAVAKQCFYTFKTWLLTKCEEYGIELRQVDRFYPSSKLCSYCGQKKVDLKLSDRVYTCNCGNVMDRDLNASINLLQAKIYNTNVNRLYICTVGYIGIYACGVLDQTVVASGWQGRTRRSRNTLRIYICLYFCSRSDFLGTSI